MAVPSIFNCTNGVMKKWVSLSRGLGGKVLLTRPPPGEDAHLTRVVVFSPLPPREGAIESRESDWMCIMNLSLPLARKKSDLCGVTEVGSRGGVCQSNFRLPPPKGPLLPAGVILFIRDRATSRGVSTLLSPSSLPLFSFNFLRSKWWQLARKGDRESRQLLPALPLIGFSSALRGAK